MATLLNENRWLAPSRGWTKGQYEKALLEGARPEAVSVPPSAPSPVQVLLRAVAVRGSWWSDAACRGLGVDFFATDEAPAKAICARCIVRLDCLADAVERRDRDGIWGGLNPRERAALKRANAA